MNDLNHQESELVAIGAAMGSNCIPCIEYHIPEARKAGLTDSQISAAIRLTDKVRQVPARKVLTAAQRMLPETSAADPAASQPAVSAPAATGEACCA
jgi:4-carboxymuconolactone decarboxylase